MIKLPSMLRNGVRHARRMKAREGRRYFRWRSGSTLANLGIMRFGSGSRPTLSCSTWREGGMDMLP